MAYRYPDYEPAADNEENQLRDTTYRATLAALIKARSIGVSAIALTTMGAGVGAGSHEERGARIGKIKAAIDGMDRALSDFQESWKLG